MGVDAEAYLNPSVEAEDIAEVISVLTGSKVSLEPLTCVSKSARVRPIPKVEGTKNGHSTLVYILPSNRAMVRYGLGLNIHYISKFNGKLHTAIRLDMSGAVEVALLNRLVDWFGGFVIANDQRDEVTHISKGKSPKRKGGWLPNGGEKWDAYQTKLAELPPLNQEDIDLAMEKAWLKDEVVFELLTEDEEREVLEAIREDEEIDDFEAVVQWVDKEKLSKVFVAKYVEAVERKREEIVEEAEAEIESV